MFTFPRRTLLSGVILLLCAMTANAEPADGPGAFANSADKFTRSLVSQDDISGPSPLAERQCLTIGLYHEARGEPEIGQIAVGETILNRVRSKAYPNTICGVVFQNSQMTNQCQFSFACDGASDAMDDRAAFDKLSKLAGSLIKNAEKAETGSEVQSAYFNERAPYMTHYHRFDVFPKWSTKLERLAQIGNHIFFSSERVVDAYPVKPFKTAGLMPLPAINASNEVGL